MAAFKLLGDSFAKTATFARAADGSTAVVTGGAGGVTSGGAAWPGGVASARLGNAAVVTAGGVAAGFKGGTGALLAIVSPAIVEFDGAGGQENVIPAFVGAVAAAPISRPGKLIFSGVAGGNKEGADSGAAKLAVATSAGTGGVEASVADADMDAAGSAAVGESGAAAIVGESGSAATVGESGSAAIESDAVEAKNADAAGGGVAAILETGPANIGCVSGLDGSAIANAFWKSVAAVIAGSAFLIAGWPGSAANKFVTNASVGNMICGIAGTKQNSRQRGSCRSRGNILLQPAKLAGGGSYCSQSTGNYCRAF